MLKSIIVNRAKKYIAKELNELIQKNKSNVEIISAKLDYWIKKLHIIVDQLLRINNRVADGVLDDDEINQSIEEVQKIIKEW